MFFSEDIFYNRSSMHLFVFFVVTLVRAQMVPTAQFNALQSFLHALGCFDTPTCPIFSPTLTPSNACTAYKTKQNLGCDANGNIDRILLSNVDALRGSISTVVGQLSFLTTLGVYGSIDGSSIRSTIPSQLGKLTAMKFFDLSFNPGLSGTVPTTLTKMSNVEFFYLKGTSVTGTIPYISSPSLRFCDIVLAYNPADTCINIANSRNCAQNGGECTCEAAGNCRTTTTTTKKPTTTTTTTRTTTRATTTTTVATTSPATATTTTLAVSTASKSLTTSAPKTLSSSSSDSDNGTTETTTPQVPPTSALAVDDLQSDSSASSGGSGDVVAIVGGVVGGVVLLLLILAIVVFVVVLRNKKQQRESFGGSTTTSPMVEMSSQAPPSYVHGAQHTYLHGERVLREQKSIHQHSPNNDVDVRFQPPSSPSQAPITAGYSSASSSASSLPSLSQQNSYLHSDYDKISLSAQAKFI